MLRGIKPDQLSVKLHGKPAQITGFSLDVAPRRVILLLDTSGSMREEGTDWKLVPKLGAYAADILPADASVAAATVNENPQIGSFGDRAHARGRILAITRDSIRGRTPLFDTIHQALLTVGPPLFGDVLYLITDGGDDVSKLNEQDVINELASRGTRVFVILAMSGRPRTEEERNGPELMLRLAEQTGGYVFAVVRSFDGSAERTALLKLAPFVESFITTSYRLQLSAPEATAKPMSLSIRYTGPKNELTKKSMWIYPHRVGPCTK
ncbi:MAG TPA: hypothetical protein VJP04_14630 [Terriglobales bacterium]|nr:hypothetical protein [Terriglobales bacterium]